MSGIAAAGRSWAPPPLIRRRALRIAIQLGAAAYLVLALGSLHVNWRRVAEGLGRGWQFLAAFAPPDFVSRADEIGQGMVESVVMTVTSTVIGIVLAVPVGLGAARNLAPLPVYLGCRALVAVARTFQEIIVAIFFVAMFGFGPLAGVLTLSFATIGFLSKLLAEDIEDVSPGPIEAVRATGASWLQLLNYGVQPQVMPRLIGLSLYRLDINFRESAIIGIVGAGGIGATLNTAFDRYEYGTAAAILLSIIAVVMAAEYLSGIVRRRVQ
ncbi:MAG TPA: phosphonate ABC transporter, permease protein PhnE [Methylomirabilota bacterium]|jgi:phosphonate transport system permease protein|nr:phosphonate ABC transporter, permease protein PhnE [Methylomirabilota bacterium]